MIVIIGAGISGLTAARHLRGEFIVLEERERAGGLAGEYTSATWSFPHGGHYFHFQNKSAVHDQVQAVMPFRRFERRSRVLLFDRFIPFPIQYHLACLPPGERALIGKQMLAAAGGCANDLEDFLQRHFGPRLVQLFFRPFLEKFYRRNLRGLLADMDRGSIPVPARDEVLAGLAGRRFDQAGYNPVFFYPASFSLQDFIDRYARPVRERIRLQRRVVGIDLRKREVETEDGRIPYRRLINTIPLNRFLKLSRWPIGDRRRLRHISTLVVNCALRERRRRFHWLYLPEGRFSFYRAGYYPARGWVPVYLERSLAAGEPFAAGQVRRDAAATLSALGMIASNREILHLDLHPIPVSYVVFDSDWPRTVPGLLRQLRQQGVHSIGRFGTWNYTSMADDMAAAMRTAELLNER